MMTLHSPGDVSNSAPTLLLTRADHAMPERAGWLMLMCKQVTMNSPFAVVGLNEGADCKESL